MNFLAHLFFGDTWEGRVGNLARDFLGKNKDVSGFSPVIQRAMLFHSWIDDFNDHHPLFHRSKELVDVFGRRLHLSHICVDVMNDHFLSINWQRFYDEPLADFIQEAYAALQEYKDGLPDLLRFKIPHMIEEDWLGSYKSIDGIRKALLRIDRIVLFDRGLESNLTAAMTKFQEHFDELNQNFLLFFPQLIRAAKDWSPDYRPPPR